MLPLFSFGCYKLLFPFLHQSVSVSPLFKNTLKKHAKKTNSFADPTLVSRQRGIFGCGRRPLFGNTVFKFHCIIKIKKFQVEMELVILILSFFCLWWSRDSFHKNCPWIPQNFLFKVFLECWYTSFYRLCTCFDFLAVNLSGISHYSIIIVDNRPKNRPGIWYRHSNNSFGPVF